MNTIARLRRQLGLRYTRNKVIQLATLVERSPNPADALAGIQAISELFNYNGHENEHTEAFRAMAAALKQFGGMDSNVAMTGCRAIWILAVNADSQSKLASVGACESVVKALQRYGTKNAEVAEKACGAIWSLAVNADNRMEIAHVGACEAVVKALQRYGTENACDAIGNLAINDNNKRRFKAAGAQHQISRCLENINKAGALRALD